MPPPDLADAPPPTSAAIASFFATNAASAGVSTDSCVSLSGSPLAAGTGPVPSTIPGSTSTISVATTVPTAHRPQRLSISTSAAGCRREASPTIIGAVAHLRLIGAFSLLRAGVEVLGSGRRHRDDTLRGREAGGSPAQSRYGDRRPTRDGSPDADPAVAA